MSSTTASGTRLNSAEPSDIEFLVSFFTDLSPILVGKRVNPELRGLHSAGCILSEALDYLDALEESPTSEQLELDSDTADETWVKDWDVQELLEWTLLEARAAGLVEESHELQRLIERLERRLTTTPRTSLSADVEPQASELTTETTTQSQSKQCYQSNSITLLPTELLCRIFKYACAPRSLALFSPLILSHINSYFRSIVLDLPSLWNTIDDSFPLPLAKLYLERSMNATLDIRIRSNGAPLVQDGKVGLFFLYLEPHAHRVKSLKIVTDDLDTLESLEELMYHGVPVGGLEKLEFGRCGNPRPNDRDLMFPLDHPSLLQELHLWGFTLNLWMDKFFAVLWRLQLSEVAILFEVLITVLEGSPCLRVLVLDGCDLLGEEERMVTAGRLVDLQFIRIDPGDMVRFTSFIRTPALASLSVVADSSTGTGSNNFLTDLVKNNKEILSVEICDYDLTENDWSAIFKHLPSLTRLRVRASYSSDEDLQALTITQTLPNLTSITLENELRLTTVLIEQMARAHPKLESIVLRGWDPSNVSAESLAVIGQLVKNVLVDTFMLSPEEDCDEEMESDTSDDFSTEGSWLSGDEHVVTRDEDT